MSNAEAWITGEYPNQKLNLKLPTGATGPQGPVGPIGPASTVPGPATELTVLDTVTGPETPGATGPQGVKGDKGDPGGIVLGTQIATNTDWNTLTADGVYRIGGQTGNTNTPPVQLYGTLYVNNVEGVGVRVNQIYYPATTGTQGRAIWMRGVAGGIWQPWRSLMASRVDSTVGRVIYQYDIVSERDQRIYSDTGWRQVAVTPVVGKVISGYVRYRRRGDHVEMAFVDVLLDPANNGFCEIVSNTEVPVGFRPHSQHRSMQAIGISNNATNQQWITNYLTIAWTHSITSGVYTITRPTANLYGTISWTTDENWPTTLPGTAAGTIQNL